MKYRYINRSFIVVLLTFFVVIYVSFIDVSPANAWATAYGQVVYQGRGLNNVIIVDNTTKSTDTSGNDERERNWDRNYEPADESNDREPERNFDSEERNFNRFDIEALGLSALSGSTTTGGDGTFSFDRLDCAADPSTKNISVQGFAGAPPDGVPAGGYFSPSSISLGDFNNAGVYGPYRIEYIPPILTPQPPSPTAIPLPTATPSPTATPFPTPTPLPSPTPLPVCGGPCNFITTNCPLDCAICAPNKEGKNVCSKTHTESGGTPSNQGLYANFLKPLSYKDFPSPTMSFMGIKLGNWPTSN